MILKRILHAFLALTIMSLSGVAAAQASDSDSPNTKVTIQQVVDINLADAATIAEAMDGVGMVKAQEIVAYREQYGKFASIDQLLEVRGIGMATLDQNRHRITVTPQ